MQTHRPLALALASLLTLTLTAHASRLTAQSDRRTISGASVAVYDLVGRVTVEPGTGSDVAVEITRRGADAQRLSIEVGELRGRNALRVVFPDDDIVYPALGRWSSSSFSLDRDGTWGGWDRGWFGRGRIRVRGYGNGMEAWADLRVLVPAGKRIDVYVGVGELTATRVDADLGLEAASAHLTVTGTKGNLHVESGSGGAEVRDASGDDVEIHTGSGGVHATNVTARRLRLDTGSGGITGGALNGDDLSVNAGSGSVRLDEVSTERGRIETGSGGVEVRIRTSPKSLDVHAGSGGVTLALPAALSADLEIDTGSGGIDSDFPIAMDRWARHHVRGRVGDGAGRIRIETGSGSVRLRRV